MLFIRMNVYWAVSIYQVHCLHMLCSPWSMSDPRGKCKFKLPGPELHDVSHHVRLPNRNVFLEEMEQELPWTSKAWSYPLRTQERGSNSWQNHCPRKSSADDSHSRNSFILLDPSLLSFCAQANMKQCLGRRNPFKGWPGQQSGDTRDGGSP